MPVEVKIGGASASGRDQEKTLDLYTKIRAAEAKLVGPDGTAKVLPADLHSFLDEVLSGLNSGSSVTILQSHAELTTAEAARLLGVSRQFLVQLLEQDQIPFHMVGTHRRVYERDLLAYRTTRDANRRKIPDDLIDAEIREGLYDLVPVIGEQSQ